MGAPKWAVLRQLVEPARLWIRYVPRVWPSPSGPWTDIATGRLGAAPPPALASGLPEVPSGPDLALDDVVYLPPVGEEAAPWRDEVAKAFAARRVPILLQLLPGQALPALSPSPTIRIVHDPLPAFAEGFAEVGPVELSSALSPAAEAAVLWPLIGGLTDDPELWRRSLELLAAEGVAYLPSLALDLPPAQRRRLAEQCGEERFHAIFHRDPPPERAFDRVARSFGLASFLPRPPIGSSRREESNRHLAALLGLAGELWLRLGRRASQGEDLFRASRWIEDSPHDVLALAREGNLSVVRQIRGNARRLVEEWAKEGKSAFLEEIEERYAA